MSKTYFSLFSHLCLCLSLMVRANYTSPMVTLSLSGGSRKEDHEKRKLSVTALEIGIEALSDPLVVAAHLWQPGRP